MGTAYGYANQYKQDSEMNTALYVKFTVDGRTFEKTYPINPAGITKEVVQPHGIPSQEWS